MTNSRMRFVRAGALAVAMLALTAVNSLAAEGDSSMFRFSKLEFSGSRHDRLLTDLDGDKLKDLAMIFSSSDAVDTYWLRTCLQVKDQGFSSNCAVFKMPSDARAFDIGEVDGKPGAELAVITDGGVEIASFIGGKFGEFKKVEGVKTILDGTHQDRPVLLRFIWDLDKDGKNEFVLPTLDGPAIYKHSGEAMELFQQIKSPVLITYKVGSLGDIMVTDDINQFLSYKTYDKRTSATFTAPDVFANDFNGDGRLDIVTLIDNTLRVFPQGADGRFAEKPVVKFKKSILPPKERGTGFAGEAMTFDDLNGDGLGDIIMMKWGTSEERTQMDRYIYYARPGLKYPDDPDQIIRSESAAVDFGMHDLNNDGKVDLVIPFFHFAPAQAFKIMTENAIKVQFRLFLMKPDGRYSQDPGKTFAKVDRRVLLNYRIDILGIIFDFKTMLEGKFHPLISFGHDFNGDGYADLVADTGSDKLEFYWGNKDVNYSQTPDMDLDFESATDYDLSDINGDGKTDIITYYESAERTKKKRELAKKSRDQGEPISDVGEEAALFDAPEGTRIKALISK